MIVQCLNLLGVAWLTHAEDRCGETSAEEDEATLFPQETEAVRRRDKSKRSKKATRWIKIGDNHAERPFAKDGELYTMTTIAEPFGVSALFDFPDVAITGWVCREKFALSTRTVLTERKAPRKSN
jgi:hypothetical protein